MKEMTFLPILAIKVQYMLSPGPPMASALPLGGSHTTVLVWDPTDGHTISTYQRHTGLIFGLAWSPDKARIASASADSTVQIWHPIANASTYTYRGHRAAVNAIAWIGSNFIASGSDDKTVQIWDSRWEAP